MAQTAGRVAMTVIVGEARSVNSVNL